MNFLRRAPRPLNSLIPFQTARPLSVHTARMSDKSTLDANKGSVGSAFQPDGVIGKQGQKIGGPLDKDGAIGKEFKADGSIGSTAQDVAEQAQGDKKPLFDKERAIGKSFTAEGAIAQVGEQVGGPFASDGATGKNFTTQGAVGGTIQKNLGEGDKS